MSKAKVYNIPAGAPFAKVLAHYVLEEAQKRGVPLPAIRILLPTRRACRTLREAFLQLTNGKPLLLPQLQPLGDVDEEELSFALSGNAELKAQLDLPPSLSPLKRRVLLARAIEKVPQFRAGFDQALKLADALGHFMDQIYTENLDMAALSDLVPTDFAAHWQITLDFLKILSETWPAILSENGVIDAADRRNRLLGILAEHWGCTSPDDWIIAAGSTGSIPAVAKLLSVISHLPNGQVILPGLDQDMDDESWNALEPSHPQYGLREIIKNIDTERIHVSCLFDAARSEPLLKQRNILAREVMRPANTTDQWLQGDFADLRNALEGISIYETAHQQDEAQIISLVMRGVLETPEKTCALITPDRTLAARVKTACQRWGITLDDSAGQRLSESLVGSFLRLPLEAALSNLGPASLLALLKHPYSQAEMPRSAYISAISELEEKAWRGLRPAPGLEGLRAHLGDNISPQLRELLRVMDMILQPFTDLLQSSNHLNFKQIMAGHITFCEGWTAPHKDAKSAPLWQGEAGEEAANLFAELFESAHLMPDMTGRMYAHVHLALLDSVKTRPAYGTHPRLMILGQLEARLIDADTVILAGLNEGSWPADPGHDPWMSRPMREKFGLPSPERSIGLAAHDFAQGLCSPHVIITRSLRTDGAPTTPARWLQRLDTVLQAAGIPPETLRGGPYTSYLKHLDDAPPPVPALRPAPCPPPEKRPKRLSVTKIETWLKDPYSIYARYILGLKALEPIEKQPDAAERGTLLHDILERFIAENPREIPPNSMDLLRSIAREELEKFHGDPALWRFWWPRFERLCEWFLTQEREWRLSARPHKTEAKGVLQIGDFTLSAIADRIDRLNDSGAALIDYKSGGTYTAKAMEDGRLPQLPLEALILLKGGFEGITAERIGYLGYWKLTGGRPAGQITALEGDLNTIAFTAEESLTALIETFNDPATPYLSLPRPDQAPRFNDYELLARVREWTALDDDSAIEEAA